MDITALDDKTKKILDSINLLDRDNPKRKDLVWELLSTQNNLADADIEYDDALISKIAERLPIADIKTNSDLRMYLQEIIFC